MSAPIALADPPELVCNRTITALSETEFLVEVIIENREVDGYARVAENIPMGFQAYEVRSSNGIFYFREGLVKVVWMTVPENEPLVIRYRLDAIRVPSGDYEIEGSALWQRDQKRTKRTIAATPFSYDNKHWAREQAQLEANAEAEAALVAAREAKVQAEKAKADSILANIEASQLAVQAAEDERMAKEAADRRAREAALDAFNREVREAEEAYARQEYEAAAASYARAGEYLPERAKEVASKQQDAEEKQVEWADRMAEEETVRQAQAQETARRTQYQELVAQADEAFSEADFDMAQPLYEQAKALLPEEEYPQKQIEKIESRRLAIERDQAFDAVMKKAEERFHTAEYAEAIPYYEEALTIKPDDYDANLQLRNTRDLLKEAAVRDSLVVLGTQRMDEGDAFFLQQRYSEAADLFEEVTKLDPTNVRAAERLAVSRERALSKARELEDAFQLHKSTAEEAYQKEDWDAAVMAYQKAADLKPEDAHIQSRLKASTTRQTVVEAERQRLNESAELAKEAELLYAAEKYENALTLFERAVILNPEDLPSHSRIEEIKNLLAVRAQDALNTARGLPSEEDKANMTEEDWLSAIADKAEEEEELSEGQLKWRQQLRAEGLDEETVAERMRTGTMPEGLTNLDGPKLVPAAVEYEGTAQPVLSAEEQARLAEMQWEDQHRDEVLEEKTWSENLPDGAKEKLGGLVYKVQIATSREPMPDTHFKGKGITEPISHVEASGLHKYMAGAFDDYSAANLYRTKLLNEGQEGAFVVIFFNGERISREDAKLLEQQR